MDVCTSLVRAYLHLNGYFTATDYPLIEERRNKPPRTLTDIDMLAVRFGDPAPPLDSNTGVKGPLSLTVDSALACTSERTDMIVAEIKQGRADVNAGLRLHRTVAAALVRFGCCPPHAAAETVRTLLQRGRAETATGHAVRMVLFASRGDRAPRGWHWVHLDHVLMYVSDYLKSNSALLKTVDFHDPALAWLALLNKCDLAIRPEEQQR